MLVTAAPALSAWTAFLALRRLVPGAAGPLAGGLLFGFSPFVMAQSLAHPHASMLAAAPLELMALHSLLVRGSPPLRTGVLLGIAATAQLFLSEEMLVVEVVTAAVSLLILAALFRAEARSRLAPLARCLGVAAATLAVLAAVPLGVQFLGPQHPHGNPESPDVFVTDAATLVVPTAVQQVAPDAAVRESDRIGAGNLAEVDGYLGIPLLALCAVAAVLWWRRRRLLRWAALSGLAVTVLAFGAHLRVDAHEIGAIPMPWHALQALPVLSMVLPTRFMGLALGFAAIVVAAVVAELTVERRHLVRGAWMAGLAAVAVSLVPSLPYAAREWTVPQYFGDGSAARIPEGSLALLAPFPSGESAQTMLWQAAAGMRFRILGGYAYHPDSAGRFTLQPDASATMGVMDDVEHGGPATRDSVDVAAVVRELRDWKVGAVVVGPDPAHDAFLQLFEQVLGRRPDAVDGDVAAWYDVSARLGATP
jgi:hypothetical protein